MDNRSLMTADFSFKNLGKSAHIKAVINALQLHLGSSLPILMENFPKGRTHRHGTARMPSINQQRHFGKSPATRPLKASRNWNFKEGYPGSPFEIASTRHYKRVKFFSCSRRLRSALVNDRSSTPSMAKALEVWVLGPTEPKLSSFVLVTHPPI
jgi:hypothetical protein